MKKVLIIFLLVVSGVSAQSSIQITEKDLVGKWLFKDIVEDSGQDNGISLQQRKEMLEGVYLLLREDKTSVMSFIIDKEGTWSLDQTANVISMKDSKINTWTIHTFTGNEIVLSRNDSKQKILFVKQ